MRYLVQFGHTPSLSNRELHEYLTFRKIKAKKETLLEDILILDTSNKTIDPSDVCKRLGGIVKVAEKVGSVKKEDQLVEVITQKLSHSQDNRIPFSVTSIQLKIDDKKISSNIKKELRSEGFSPRFILGEKYGLNPLVIESQSVFEYLITQEQGNYQIYQTKAVTPVLDWQERDRARPAVDDFSGIMPPKVARMLINIATKTSTKPLKVYDPFCGSGTVLAESLYLGYQAYGSDISSKAISDTKNNLEALIKKGLISGSYAVEQGSAIEDSLSKEWPKMDAIVFEGDLGPTRFERSEISQIEDELTNFYLKVIPQLSQNLAKKGRIVCALPYIVSGKPEKMQQVFIDAFEESGYNLLSKPILYGKQHAQVKRAIYLLDKF